MTFKVGSWNIADFIVYKYPTMYFIELKTCQGASLPRQNISDHQLSGMFQAVSKKGIKA